MLRFQGIVGTFTVKQLGRCGTRVFLDKVTMIDTLRSVSAICLDLNVQFIVFLNQFPLQI